MAWYSKKFILVLSLIFLTTVISKAEPVQAQTPGLGNLTYQQSELFTDISVVNSPQGHGRVAMVKGYLMVIYSSDGGGTSGDGGIEFWDVSDPRNPTLAVRHDNAERGWEEHRPKPHSH